MFLHGEFLQKDFAYFNVHNLFPFSFSFIFLFLFAVSSIDLMTIIILAKSKVSLCLLAEEVSQEDFAYFTEILISELSEHCTSKRIPISETFLDKEVPTRKSLRLRRSPRRKNLHRSPRQSFRFRSLPKRIRMPGA